MYRPQEKPTDAIETALGWHKDDLSAFEFKLSIAGRPFTLKNSKKAVIRGLKVSQKSHRRCPSCKVGLAAFAGILPSSQAEKYQKDATLQLRAQWRTVIGRALPEDLELNVAIVSYRGTRHKNDASNLYQGPEDALEAAGVLENDFSIRSHNGSDRRYSKETPRVDIFITPNGTIHHELA